MAIETDTYNINKCMYLTIMRLQNLNKKLSKWKRIYENGGDSWKQEGILAYFNKEIYILDYT